MRVVVPFTEPHPEVFAALDATGFAWEATNVSCSDDAYWTWLARLWAEGETFVIVEHDVVVRPATLSELAECPEPWCAFPVPYYDREWVGMSCVKFSADLLKADPSVMEDVGMMSARKHPAKHWCGLDVWIQGRLNVTRHVHEPALVHLGANEPKHGCHLNVFGTVQYG